MGSNYVSKIPNLEQDAVVLVTPPKDKAIKVSGKRRYESSDDESGEGLGEEGTAELEKVVSSMVHWEGNLFEQENQYQLDVLFKECKASLTEEEIQTLEKLLNWRSLDDQAYKHCGCHLILTVEMARGMLIYDDLDPYHMDVLMYDLYLRALEKHTNILYLPVKFQEMVTEVSHVLGTKSPTGETALRVFFNLFVPENTSHIEEAYIPIYDNIDEHWILLVINAIEKRWYLLDSSVTRTSRISLAIDVMSKASKLFGNDPRLGRFFYDFLGFSFDMPSVHKQDKGFDSAMYVLKYIEASKNTDWSDLAYTTQQMRVERFKALAKLLGSKNNNSKHFGFPDFINLVD